MKKTILFIVFALSIFASRAQYSRYIVKLNDKGTSPFSLSTPSAYLSQRAIDRRIRYNISLDSTDLPVTPRYVDSIRLSGNVTILNVSKWLNEISIETIDADALIKINSFPFVNNTQPIAARSAITRVNKIANAPLIEIPSIVPTIQQNLVDVYNYGKSNGQVKIHQGDFLHNHGFRGDGMQLAVLDGGFYHYNTLPTFDSININNQVLGTWDFVANESSVAEDDVHGMDCLSTIAANMPGIFVGTAPKTSFYLFRTEDVNSEYPIEEHNLAVGEERADSVGVDVCSISLGYTDFDDPSFNYSYSDMNGYTTISARASAIAIRKGLLIVIAAGNEGDKSWHYITTPADTDSAFTIGAVDTLGQVAVFSSYGPSSDGQIKPNAASVGRFAVVANPGTGLPSYSNGTSFACPNMAGITTCLWQAFPEANNIEIINTLQQSASNYTTPDDRTGYGIPDAKKAFVLLQQKYHTQTISVNQCKANLVLSVKTDNTMSIEVERKFANEAAFTTITTLQSNLPYGMHEFLYTDDIINSTSLSVQYRLKMIIGTDTTYYLDDTTLNFTEPCNSNPSNEESIVISPNPVNDFVNVYFSNATASRVAVVIVNAVGQRVYTDDFQHTTGIFSQDINMKNFSKGAYFVTVYIDKRKAITKKIIKQ